MTALSFAIPLKYICARPWSGMPDGRSMFTDALMAMFHFESIIGTVTDHCKERRYL